jgi:hypothetical protein
MFKLAVPLLHVSSSAAAESFYCGQLGFERQNANRLDAAAADPCYMGLKRDNAWLNYLEFLKPSTLRPLLHFTFLHESVNGRRCEFILGPESPGGG